MLTHPHCQSLLPSNVIDWVVVIAVIVRTMPMPLNILEASRERRCTLYQYHLHRTSIPLVGGHVHYLHHIRSTSYKVYCRRVGTLLPRIAYITYVYKHACVSVYLYLCVYLSVHVCVHVCACLSVCACAILWYAKYLWHVCQMSQKVQNVKMVSVCVHVSLCICMRVCVVCQM